MARYQLRYPGFRTKALTLSYDDGVTSDIPMVELLNRYGIKGTFNLNSGRLNGMLPGARREDGTERYLDAQQVRELYLPSGHEVAIHTVTHPVPDQLPHGAAAWEIVHDREELEGLLNTFVRGMAYPYGTQDARMVETARLCGLAYARTVESRRNFLLPKDWLQWGPTCHHGDPGLESLCQRFLESNRPWYLQLFYLWGHSYEFDNADNWDVLEKFCQTMGGRDDIWYATNIDICDYVSAARQLRTTMDGSMLHNPTAVTLYLRAAGENVTLAPGQTMELG